MPKNQLNLPPSLLANRPQGASTTQGASATHDSAASADISHAADPVRPQHTPEDPQVKAARVFDTALHHSGRSSDEAAFCLEISSSLVRRMRSKDARESLSTTQLFKLCRDLGPRFTYEYHKAFHTEHRLATVALRDVLESLSLLAVGVE